MYPWRVPSRLALVYVPLFCIRNVTHTSRCPLGGIHSLTPSTTSLHTRAPAYASGTSTIPLPPHGLSPFDRGYMEGMSRIQRVVLASTPGDYDHLVREKKDRVSFSITKGRECSLKAISTGKGWCWRVDHETTVTVRERKNIR